MQAKGFFGSLFDYSFSSFVTPRIIKVLYVLATILIAVWTIFLVAAAFNVSDGAGGAMLLIGGPLFFLLSMIYARVLLELVIVFFRINGNVQEIRDDRIGGAMQPAPTPAPPPEDAPVVAVVEAPPQAEPEPAVTASLEEPSPAAAIAAATPSEPEPEREPEPEAEPDPPATSYCENCGAERRPGGRFCTACGHA